MIASVVIPARNAAPFIEEQLTSLAAQSNAPEFEVVLADNESTDGTAAIAERTASSLGLDLRVVDATGPASASHGRNVGAEQALGEILLFCDADDLVGEHWVADLVAAVQSLENVVVGGALHHGRFNAPAVLGAYGIASDPSEEELERSSRVVSPSGGFAGYLHTVPGGNFDIRRADYLRLGGMDPA